MRYEVLAADSTMPASGYYDNERPEVALLVPPSARMILDVGCGTGRLGAMLKRSGTSRKVYGIEYNPAVAAEARKVLDGVLIGDLQTMEITFEREFFDCIIYADVLEHLLDPVAVLRKLRPFLKGSGVIVSSIPNIRHYTALLQIALHGWEYTDFGLFDRTHVRFFSRRTMEELLTQGGFGAEFCQPRIVASRKMKFLNTLCFGRLEEFITFQYLIRAHPEG
jgi:2-polyprenyl-3-methyl-5-hydroxy-6-metoxy-1,4-benzoquinol methylase